MEWIFKKNMKMKKEIMAVAAVVACVALGANAAEDCVRASSFGWNAEDASACLEKALGSGAEKVIVDKQASDWIIDERLHDITVTNKEDEEKTVTFLVYTTEEIGIDEKINASSVPGLKGYALYQEQPAGEGKKIISEAVEVKKKKVNVEDSLLSAIEDSENE